MCHLLDPHPHSLNYFYYTHFMDEEARLTEGNTALFNGLLQLDEPGFKLQCVCHPRVCISYYVILRLNVTPLFSQPFIIWKDIISFVLFYTGQYHLLIVWKNRNKLILLRGKIKMFCSTQDKKYTGLRRRETQGLENWDLLLPLSSFPLSCLLHPYHSLQTNFLCIPAHLLVNRSDHYAWLTAVKR